MTPLIILLNRARAAGLVIDRDGDKLHIRGGRSHERLVKELLNRKTDILPIVDLYNGRAIGLDWRHAAVAEKPRRCVLCHRWAMLRDPFDFTPMHKTCAEDRIRPLTASGAKSPRRT